MKTLTQKYGRVVGIVRPAEGLDGRKFEVREKGGAYYCPCVAWERKKVCRHTRKIQKERVLKKAQAAGSDWELPDGLKERLLRKLYETSTPSVIDPPQPQKFTLLEELEDIFTRIREEPILSVSVINNWGAVLEKLFTERIAWRKEVFQEISVGWTTKEPPKKEEKKPVEPAIRKYNLTEDE